MNKISTFRGEYHFLSNFYQHPFEYRGLVYPNAEAAFQAQKCSTDADSQVYSSEKSCQSQADGQERTQSPKKLGRNIL